MKYLDDILDNELEGVNIKPNRKRVRLKPVFVSVVLILAVAVFGFGVDYFLHLNKVYTADDFGIDTVRSGVDFNDNRIDDYSDFVLGARAYIETNPRYDGRYWEDGYPPENIGVCTDVIWMAFKNAGYCLKDMVDRDIEGNLALYPRVGNKADPNIDFRRVPNLMVFFERYAISLTLDTDKIEEWQPGDIVTYNQDHIAVVSDKRNRRGVPYIIHNGGEAAEENSLVLSSKTITGHFRFDAQKVPEELLIAFK